MEKQFYAKYSRLLEALPDVAECAAGKLALVGGTALTLFYLKHRISIDLDFVPIGKGNDARLKEGLKGCLSKKGYTTLRVSYTNQFVIQFDDSSIKVEVFHPQTKVLSFEEHPFGNAKLKVASLDDLFRMKSEAYLDRRAARDLFDCVCIMRQKDDFSRLGELVRDGLPDDLAEAGELAFNKVDYDFFLKVVDDASKTSD